MKKFISLGQLETPILEFASSGNAAVGIRASGKTYAMTGIAEQLLDANIPFVAFDPIGVWRNLKVPGAGKGYKIVVAHPTTGDLPLTPESAPEIVRAAMRENIPLVIDLYAMNLSKADWKRIVESCIRVLLYENKDHGLRHIFIEEAAEFCPQVVSSDNAKVYAEVEKLARMGGNSSLGYTLINQRSEQLNKAVLELCECLFLFRQKGKNSLTALGKWLDYASPEISKEIIKTMPTLPTGECWAWLQGETNPQHVKMPTKNSFHPDRQNPSPSKGANTRTDVSAFVSTLSASLEHHIQVTRENDPAQLRKRIAELERASKSTSPAPKPIETIREVPILKEADIARLEAIIEKLTGSIGPVEQLIRNFKHQPRHVAAPIQHRHTFTPKATSNNSNGSSVGRCEMAILKVLAQFPQGRTTVQIALLSGYSVSSGGFNNSLGSLRSAELITRGSPVKITESGLKVVGDFEPIPTGMAAVEYWLTKLGKCERSIVSALASKDSMTKEELGDATGYSVTSGGFNNSLGSLRTLEIITRGNPIQLNPDFFA